MEFAEVDNHDDFYSHEEGRVHVRDQRGVYIIYDASMDDYKFVTPVYQCQSQKVLILMCDSLIFLDNSNKICCSSVRISSRKTVSFAVLPPLVAKAYVINIIT